MIENIPAYCLVFLFLSFKNALNSRYSCNCTNHEVMKHLIPLHSVYQTIHTKDEREMYNCISVHLWCDLTNVLVSQIKLESFFMQ